MYLYIYIYTHTIYILTSDASETDSCGSCQVAAHATFLRAAVSSLSLDASKKQTYSTRHNTTAPYGRVGIF